LILPQLNSHFCCLWLYLCSG